MFDDSEYQETLRKARRHVYDPLPSGRAGFALSFELQQPDGTCQSSRHLHTRQLAHDANRDGREFQASIPVLQETRLGLHKGRPSVNKALTS